MLQRKILVCTLLCLSAMLVYTRSGQKPIKAITLEEARRVLVEPSSTEVLMGVPLAEFESYREIDIGGNRRVLAISCSHSGGLIAFGSDGKAFASVPTGAIASFQIFDLAEDGNSMIVTDEVVGWGTGLLQKSFLMYRVTTNEIYKVWTGESFFRSAPWTTSGKIQVTEKRCFVRFDPSSAAIEATFTHACATTDGRHLTAKIYEWHEDSLKERRRSP
jgi:hypothetical protein